MPRFLDVAYSALMEGLPGDERARLDDELVLPLGVTGDLIEQRRKAVLAEHGWA